MDQRCKILAREQLPRVMEQRNIVNPDEAVERLHEAKCQYLLNYDTTVLDAAVDAVLRSFLDSEKRGHTHAETVNAAQHEPPRASPEPQALSAGIHS